MSNERSVHRFRLTSAAFMGVGSLAAALVVPGGLASCGVGLPRPGLALLMGLALPVVALPVLKHSVSTPRGRGQYPQIRGAVWDAPLIMRNAASWTLYLLSYEFFFRGLLLFTLTAWAGAPAALVFTTVLYVIAHLTKDPLECLATAPMGFVFGAMALYAGSFWPVFAAHVGIAVAAETMAGRLK